MNKGDKNAQRVESSWVSIIKETLFENSSFSIITLPHPAHGKPTKYCLDESHSKIYELVTFNEPYRSWFIQQTVKSDGALLMMTPINPLFLILPRLKKFCSHKAVPLEDLLSEKGFDKIVDLVNNLDEIGDIKGPEDIKAYKYNEEKTLSWLEARVRKLAQVLRDKNIHVTSGAVSATFVTSDKNIDEEFYLKYAHGLVSEYLDQELEKKLETRFNFKNEQVEAVGKKRKSDSLNNESFNKKVKCEFNENEFTGNLNGVNGSVLDKKRPLSSKEKSRQKAASGTKSISSFFAKK